MRKKRNRVGRPEKNGESTREALLQAAVELFAAETVSAASVKSVADRAGVSPAMVYYYFQGKKELIDAVFTEIIMPVVSEILSVVKENAGEPVAMVRGLQRKIAAVAMETRWMLPLWSREIVNESGMLRSYLLRYVDRDVLRMFGTEMAEGQRRGLINSDLSPELIFISVVSTTLLPMLTHNLWKSIIGIESPSSINKHMEAFCMNGVMGDI